jgi:hypothetical protein
MVITADQMFIRILVAALVLTFLAGTSKKMPVMRGAPLSWCLTSTPGDHSGEACCCRTGARPPLTRWVGWLSE